MAKLKPEAITTTDLEEFIASHSDFEFELQVLNWLTVAGFSCEHGGTYEDPVTSVPRQFDIRASYKFSAGHLILRTAVECKRLRNNNPLLVSCSHRRAEEAFHEVIVSVDPEKMSFADDSETGFESPIDVTLAKTARIEHDLSIYTERSPVGKACNLVGRLEHSSGGFSSGDKDVYERWAQALSSADDLALEAYTAAGDAGREGAMTVVLPILVVPNGTLFKVVYDEVGQRTSGPEPADRVSFFVGRRYWHRLAGCSDGLTLSHLEIVTFEGLTDFLSPFLDGRASPNQLFRVKECVSQVSSQQLSAVDQSS